MTFNLEDIQKIRKKLGLTQFELAKRSGVSQSMIAKTEAGRLDPSYTNARKIFRALEEIGRKKEIKAVDIMNKKIICIKPQDKIKNIILKMKKHEISQMPVLEDNMVVGLISESIILEGLTGKKCDIVSDIMKEPPPIISHKTTSEVISNLLKYYPMVLVSKKGKLIGLITRADLLGKIV